MHILYMSLKSSKKVAKSSKKVAEFYCDVCDYYTSHKYNFDKHLSSNKHLKKALIKVAESSKKVAESSRTVEKIYVCEHCNKEYSDRSGLWRHKKKCKIIELEKKLSKQEGKNEAYKEIIENKGLGNVINNNNNNNSYNNCNNTNNISLNVFLNDYCKDAINLEDFMKGIKFKLKDVLNEGNYVDNCVSVKLLNDLNDMPVTKRPIHCTDKRRKNFVVKDKEEGWITEKGNQSGKMSKHINNLYGKAYIDFYHEYDEEHPLPHSNRQVDEKSETSSKIMQKKDKHYIIGTLAKNLDVKEAIKEVADK